MNTLKDADKQKISNITEKQSVGSSLKKLVKLRKMACINGRLELARKKQNRASTNAMLQIITDGGRSYDVLDADHWGLDCWKYEGQMVRITGLIDYHDKTIRVRDFQLNEQSREVANAGYKNLKLNKNKIFEEWPFSDVVKRGFLTPQSL